MEPAHQKIEVGEMVLYTLLAILVSGACAILDLFVVGLLISPLLNAAFVLILDYTLLKPRGGQTTGKIGRQIAKYAAGLIPILPTSVAVLWFEIVNHNHPKLTALATKTGGAALGGALGGPAGARIGQAVGGYATNESASQAIRGNIVAAPRPSLQRSAYREAA